MRATGKRVRVRVSGAARLPGGGDPDALGDAGPPDGAPLASLFDIATRIEEVGGILRGIQRGLGLLIDTERDPTAALLRVLEERLADEVVILAAQEAAVYALARTDTEGAR